MSKVMNALWKVAKKLPDVEEGIACEGTALERRTAKVAKKAFLFLGSSDAMVKLDASAKAARALGLSVGKNGWVKIPYSDDEPPPKELAAKWIAESHGLMRKTPKKTSK